MGGPTETFDIDEESGYRFSFETLEEFRQEAFLCDIQITSSSRTKYPCHKNILATRSAYFRQMFSSDVYVESKSGVVALDEIDAVVEELLNYIYKGSISITGETAQHLLRASDQYQLPKLFDFLDAYIAERVDVENCVLLLGLAKKLKAKKLERKTVCFLEKEFEALDVTELDADTLLMMSKSCVVLAEGFVHQLEQWFRKHKDIKAVCASLENISFAGLSKDTLLNLQECYKTFPECMDVLYKQVVKIASSQRFEPLDLKVGAFCSIEVGKIVLANSFVAGGPSRIFTFEKREGSVLVSQRGGIRGKCLICADSFGIGSCYIVHDFSSSDHCFMKTSRLAQKCSVYEVLSDTQLSLQREARFLGRSRCFTSRCASGTTIFVEEGKAGLSVVFVRERDHCALKVKTLGDRKLVAIAIHKESHGLVRFFEVEEQATKDFVMDNGILYFLACYAVSQ